MGSLRIRRLLSLEEKAESRSLYEQVFPEDSSRFLDFYYNKRCRSNVIFAAEAEGSIVGMLHINPYTLCRVKGDVLVKFPISYIYAVATHKDFRHRGIMRGLLREGFEWMKEQGIYISFLIPVAEEIYTPFGYETVCRLSTGGESDTISGNIESNELLSQKYDFFCDRDESYMELIAEERAIAMEEGGATGLPEEALVMMKVHDSSGLSDAMALTGRLDSRGLLDLIKGSRIYISEDI